MHTHSLPLFFHFAGSVIRSRRRLVIDVIIHRTLLFLAWLSCCHLLLE